MEKNDKVCAKLSSLAALLNKKPKPKDIPSPILSRQKTESVGFSDLLKTFFYLTPI